MNQMTDGDLSQTRPVSVTEPPPPPPPKPPTHTALHLYESQGKLFFFHGYTDHLVIGGYNSYFAKSFRPSPRG